MKKILILVFIALMLFGCAEEETAYKTIDPETAYENLQEDDSILLMDVRTKEEFLLGTIPGSVLVPLDTIEENMEDLYPDKEQEIYVFCRSGNRSQTASNLLIELGYTNVHDLGGIIDWPYDIY